MELLTRPIVEYRILDDVLSFLAHVDLSDRTKAEKPQLAPHSSVDNLHCNSIGSSCEAVMSSSILKTLSVGISLARDLSWSEIGIIASVLVRIKHLLCPFLVQHTFPADFSY